MAQTKKKKAIALLTSCSVTRNYEPIVRIEDAPIVKTMDQLCEWWADKMQIDYDGREKTPGEIYAGTSFTAVTEIAQDIGHDNVFIITGGAGMARHTDQIAPYDFTADKKALSNAHQHVTGEKFLPHVWWAKINQALHGTATPIADLLSEYETVVGALPKMFTKYILDDLAACDAQKRTTRIFIPITASMYRGVPKIVRGAYVPYTPDYLDSIMYSRVDKPQRVAQKFLREAAEHDFVSVATSMAEAAASHTPSEHSDIDYDEMFQLTPIILEANDVNTAIHRAKGHGYKIGGNAKFAGAWRAAKGRVEVHITVKEQASGVSALSKIISQTDRMSDDSVILERLGAFVEAVKTVDEHLIFTASEVVEWAKEMYADNLQGMDNTNKVSYILGYNATYLGLEALKVGSRKGFKLIQD